MRVLALTRYGRLGASSRLRTLQYVGPLAATGIELTPEPLLGDDYLRALYGRHQRVAPTIRGYLRRFGRLLGAGGYDAVWIEKEALPWMPALIELNLWPRGIPIVLDYDDAVFHRYDSHPSSAVRALLGHKLDRLMARAELVVAGNQYLADRAHSVGAPRVEIIPTVVDLSRYRPATASPARRLTIGWIGSPSTAHYLDIVKPALARLRQSVDFRAVAIGARPEQVVGSVFEAVPWSEATEVQTLSGIDVGVMPLPDNPWERGKCGYKLIQYMALGLPVIASPVGANRTIVGGDAGFLPADGQAWLADLAALAADPKLRHEMGLAGRRRVEAGFSLSIQAPRLARFLTSLAK